MQRLRPLKSDQAGFGLAVLLMIIVMAIMLIVGVTAWYRETHSSGYTETTSPNSIEQSDPEPSFEPSSPVTNPAPLPAPTPAYNPAPVPSSLPDGTFDHDTQNDADLEPSPPTDELAQ